jgi:hypothetical protein
MAVDVEEACLVLKPLDDMIIPDLVEQGARTGCRHHNSPK